MIISDFSWVINLVETRQAGPGEPPFVEKVIKDPLNQGR